MVDFGFVVVVCLGCTAATKTRLEGLHEEAKPFILRATLL